MSTKNREYTCIKCKVKVSADLFEILRCGQRSRICGGCKVIKAPKVKSEYKHEWLTPDEKLSLKYLLMKF